MFASASGLKPLWSTRNYVEPSSIRLFTRELDHEKLEKIKSGPICEVLK